MFGFGDFWVAAAYYLCLGSTVLCVVYGLMHWNDEEDASDPVHPTDEDLEFEEVV